MNYFIRLSIVGLLTLYSCVYDSDEMVFREIQPPSGVVPINLLNAQMDGDTIFIDSWMDTDIIIEAGEYEVLKSKVTTSIGERVSYGNKLKTNDLVDNGDQYGIVIEVEISSKNKSIGASLGVERYLLTSKFIVKKIDYISFKYLKEESVDGKYKLIWPKINSDIVNKYVVHKSIPGNVPMIDTLETTNNWLIDEYYVGESIEFYIHMIDLEGNKYLLWRHRRNQNDELKFVVNNDGKYELHWPKLQYTHNIADLSIYKNERYIPDKKLYTSSNLELTSFELSDAKFGSDGYYYLEITFKNQPPYYSSDKHTYTWRGGYVGEKFEEYYYNFLGQLNSEDFLIIQKQHVLKYANGSDIPHDAIDYMYFRDDHFTLSADGKCLAYVSSDRDEISIWHTNKLISTPVASCAFSYVKISSVTSKGTCLIALNSSNTPILYDLINHKELYRFGGESIINSDMSGDGEYIYFSYPYNHIYRLEEGNMQLVREWDFRGFSYYAFDPTNPSFLYTSTRDKITVYDLASNKIVYERNTEYPIEYIDFYSRRGIIYEYDKIVVFDIDTQQVTHEIPSDRELTSYSYKLFLIDKTIYSTIGIKYELQ